jgi:CubicO group peptidase (beta-lactamase class C family)
MLAPFRDGVSMLRIVALITLMAVLLPARQAPPGAKPESAGMSAERLARIGDWLDPIIARKEAAGFVTLVARRGKVVHHEARGTRGLTVRDPISDYLPGFKNPLLQVGPEACKPTEGPMTVRHLFTHTSGVKDLRPRTEKFSFLTLKAYMAAFMKLPLQAQPGSQFLFGDSHDVLGYLVQEVSGQPLGQFLPPPRTNGGLFSC